MFLLISFRQSICPLTRWFSKAAAGLPKIRKNEAIRANEVMLLDQDGTKQGIDTVRNILSRIDRKVFDLVEVNSSHSPPICRLVSRTEAFKRALSMEEAASRQRLRLREKEIRFGTSMADRDFEIRMGRVREVLEKAWRVKVVVEPKGILGRTSLSKEKQWSRIVDELSRKYGRDLTIISRPQIEFRNLSAIVALNSAKPPQHPNKQEQSHPSQESVE